MKYCIQQKIREEEIMKKHVYLWLKRVLAAALMVALVAGFVAAFISGCFACRFMIEIVRRQRLVWFALYCAVVGIGTIIYSIY